MYTRRATAESCSSSGFDFWGTSILICTVAAQIHFPTNTVWVFLMLAMPTGVRWNLGVVLVRISLIAKNIEHFFMHLLAIVLLLLRTFCSFIYAALYFLRSAHKAMESNLTLQSQSLTEEAGRRSQSLTFHVTNFFTVLPRQVFLPPTWEFCFFPLSSSSLLCVSLHPRPHHLLALSCPHTSCLILLEYLRDEKSSEFFLMIYFRWYHETQKPGL
jgi:hypothetical protein